MAVMCDQVSYDGSVSTYEVEKHFPEQTDKELLAAKEAGGTDRGWVVTASTARQTAMVRDYPDGKRKERTFRIV